MVLLWQLNSCSYNVYFMIVCKFVKKNFKKTWKKMHIEIKQNFIKIFNEMCKYNCNWWHFLSFDLCSNWRLSLNRWNTILPLMCICERQRRHDQMFQICHLLQLSLLNSFNNIKILHFKVIDITVFNTFIQSVHVDFLFMSYRILNSMLQSLHLSLQYTLLTLLLSSKYR